MSGASAATAEQPTLSVQSTETASSLPTGLASDAVAASTQYTSEQQQLMALSRPSCADVDDAGIVRLGQELPALLTGFRSIEFLAELCRKPKKQRVEMTVRRAGITATIQGTLSVVDDDGPWVAWDPDQKPGRHDIVTLYPPSDGEVLDFKFTDTKFSRPKTKRIEIDADDDDDEAPKSQKKSASTPVSKGPPISKPPPAPPVVSKPTQKVSLDQQQLDAAFLNSSMSSFATSKVPLPIVSSVPSPLGASSAADLFASHPAFSAPAMSKPPATMSAEQTLFSPLQAFSAPRPPATMSADQSTLFPTTLPNAQAHPQRATMSAMANHHDPTGHLPSAPSSYQHHLGPYASQFPAQHHQHHMSAFMNQPTPPGQFNHYAPFQNQHPFYSMQPGLPPFQYEDFSETLLTRNLRKNVSICEGLRVPATVDHPYTALYPNLMMGAAGTVDWRAVWKDMLDRMAVSFKDPTLRDAFDLHRDTLLVLSVGQRPTT